MSSAKSSSTDSQILWSHIDSLLHPIESSSSSHSQPSPAVQQLDLTGDYKADRKLSVDALERGVDTKTIARAWFQHHAWRPAYSTIMGWKNNDNLLICGSRKGGRARLIGPSEFLEFADKLKSCMPDGIIPEEGKFYELATEAILATYRERNQAPPISIELVKSTLWRILHNYWGDHQPLAYERLVPKQTHSRFVNEHDIRNPITLAVLLKRYDQPFPSLDWKMAPDGHMNMDSTTIQFGYDSHNHIKIFLEANMDKEYRKSERNVKVTAPRKSPISPFGVKLLTAMSAAGDILPLVCIFTAPALDCPFRWFEVNDFCPRSGIGYVVVVPNTQGKNMLLVYDWYFNTVLLPHIEAKADQLKRRGRGYPEGDPRREIEERFLVTLDGELIQLASINNKRLLQLLKERHIGVVKLMATCTARFQPSDVALCYKLLKFAMRRMSKSYQSLDSLFVQPGVLHSLAAIRAKLMEDKSTSAWRRDFISHVEFAVKAIATAMHQAFTPSNIIKAFRTIGWWPLNQDKILARSLGASPATLALAKAKLPLLLEQSKDYYTVTEQQMTEAGIPSVSEKDAKEEVLSPEKQASKDAAFMERPDHRARAIDLTHAAHAEHVQARLQMEEQQRLAAQQKKQEKQRNSESKKEAKREKEARKRAREERKAEKATNKTNKRAKPKNQVEKEIEEEAEQTESTDLSDEFARIFAALTKK